LAGSNCTQHSIIPHEEDIACGFIPDDDGIITFIRPPYYINIIINDNTIHKSYEIDGCNVLPITRLTTIKPNIIYGLKFLKSTYDLGFATTFQTVQGNTVNKIILNFSHNFTHAKVRMNSIYVALSRVRNSGKISI